MIEVVVLLDCQGPCVLGRASYLYNIQYVIHVIGRACGDEV